MLLDADDWGLNEALAEYDAHEFRIYAPDLRKYCVVDEIDYHWIIKNRWCIKRCKYLKEYFRRAVGVSAGGVRLHTYSLYLHVEIMRRVSQPPVMPDGVPILVDHRDGDTFNNRRNNLRWATRRMNALNKHGRYPREFFD